MARRKGKQPEYVVICREFNRKMARIDITVIDSGVTEQLMKGLITLHMRDPHKRYFLTNKKDYQKYGALMKKQIETMSIRNNKHMVELGADMDEKIHIANLECICYNAVRQKSKQSVGN